MDLSAFIVVGLGILFFVGGAAWLEARSRKGKRADGRGERPQPAALRRMVIGKGSDSVA